MKYELLSDEQKTQVRDQRRLQLEADHYNLTNQLAEAEVDETLSEEAKAQTVANFKLQIKSTENKLGLYKG
jgi:hypothetical protein